MELELVSKDLLNDIKLLNVIMNDLENCVKDQGEKIDLIENNLSMTDNTTIII